MMFYAILIGLKFVSFPCKFSHGIYCILYGNFLAILYKQYKIFDMLINNPDILSILLQIFDTYFKL